MHHTLSRPCPSSTHRRLRLAAAGTVLALTATVAAGCGTGSGHGSGHGSGDAGATHEAPNGDVYDDADVAFATRMIPHHAQAVQMVTLTDGRTLTPAFAKLTESIRAAQVPEIEQMSGWLTDWGKKVPATSNDHANADHGMGDMDGGGASSDGPDSADMPGMMDQDDVDELEATTGSDFEKRWLTMMIRHHEGAVEMARTEIEDGTFADAVALARSIGTSQTAEIETMRAMLDGS